MVYRRMILLFSHVVLYLGLSTLSDIEAAVSSWTIPAADKINFSMIFVVFN